MSLEKFTAETVAKRCPEKLLERGVLEKIFKKHRWLISAFKDIDWIRYILHDTYFPDDFFQIFQGIWFYKQIWMIAFVAFNKLKAFEPAAFIEGIFHGFSLQKTEIFLRE